VDTEEEEISSRRRESNPARPARSLVWQTRDLTNTMEHKGPSLKKHLPKLH
jgi:hypothetical protein